MARTEQTNESFETRARVKRDTEPTSQSSDDHTPSGPSNQPTLPAELICLILEAITTKADLAQASLVCHLFRRVIQPALYRHVGISMGESDADKESRAPTQLLQFARSIANDPRLGEHIRSIHIQSLPYDDYGDLNEDSECNKHFDNEAYDAALEDITGSEEEKADYRFVIKAASTLGLPNGLILKSPCQGIYLFVFQSSPNLDSLSITSVNSLSEFSATSLGLRRGGIPSGFQNLRTVGLVYDDTELGFSTASVIPFMALPSIERLTVWAFAGEEDRLESLGGTMEENDLHGAVENEHEDEDEGESEAPNVVATNVTNHVKGKLTPGSSSVQHLMFHHSAVSGEALEQILKLPRGLKAFGYEYGGAIVGDADYDPESIHRGLLSQANTLERLSIVDEDGEFDEFGPHGPIPRSLAAFTRLTHIEIDAIFLLGHPPANIPTDVAINPLDSLLPTSVIIVRLDLQRKFSRPMFAGVTGLPRSLYRTEGLLPRLDRIYVVGFGEESGAEEQGSSSDQESIEEWAKLVSTGHRVQVQLGNLAGM